MGGITMWIILGSLVGVVAIFLVVASILDRKKMKKVKAERAELQKQQQGSRTNVAIWVNLVAEENAKLMKKFVPSVGKLKMSDIKDKAKKTLEILEKRKEFKVAVDAKENADLVKKFKELKEINSNIWDSKGKEVLAFFAKEEELGLNGKPKKASKIEADKKGKVKKVKVSLVNNDEVIAASKAFKEEAKKIISEEYK